MRICHGCRGIIDRPEYQGHRKRKFCSNACRQKFYRKHQSERKRDINAPFWKEQAETWQRLYKDAEERNQRLSAELDKERRYGDMLKEQNGWLREKQEWLEARLIAVEEILHIVPLSPEIERILEQTKKELDNAFRHEMRQFQAELNADLEAWYQERVARIEGV